jgi:hypothetical protein
MKLEFFRQIFENMQISNFMKIRQVGTELFHAEGQTGWHYEANCRFLQFSNAPHNVERCTYLLQHNELIYIYVTLAAFISLSQGCRTLSQGLHREPPEYERGSNLQ